MLNLILTHLSVHRPNVSATVYPGPQHEPEFWFLYAR